jgi:hypothetical protein
MSDSRGPNTLRLLNRIVTELAVAVGFLAIAVMAVNGVTDPNVGPFGAIVALGGGKLVKDYYGVKNGNGSA